MNLVRFHVIHRLHVTKPDTLGITITEVAFGHLSVYRIEMHGTKWTDRYTRSATDTHILIHHHSRKRLITGNGLYRTDVQAGSILTLLTRHRDIKAFRLPLYDPDTTSGWVRNPFVRRRTHEFAQPAAGAFFMIYLEDFSR
jgi:hypothetical protein